MSLSYEKSGVSIDTADAAKKQMAETMATKDPREGAGAAGGGDVVQAGEAPPGPRAGAKLVGMKWIRPITNLLNRRKDPTRGWVFDPARVVVDVRACSVCGVALGGRFEGLSPLGPSEDARRASRGLLDWPSQGVGAVVDGGRISDLVVSLSRQNGMEPYRGRFLCVGRVVSISPETTAAGIVEILGEPFGRSGKDRDPLLFYEFAEGEVQFCFFADTGRLMSIEFWYEPELAQDGAMKYYGIERELPAEFRRKMPEG